MQIRSKGAVPGHMTYFTIFGTSLYLGEWLKLETSNLAQRLTTISVIKNAKLGQRGSDWVM